MELLTTEESLQDVCKSLELVLGADQAFDGQSIEIVRLETFDDFPEANTVQGVRETGACYRPSTNAVYLNWPVFGAYSIAVQASVLAHELGHAYVARTGKVPEVYGSMTSMAGEEVYVDRLACLWGHGVGLREMRLQCYGENYVAALDKWPDESAYAKAMYLWWLKYTFTRG